MINIREFTFSDEDYAIAVSIHNRVWPDYQDTAEEWKHHDKNRDPKIKYGRFLAFKGETPVGLGFYGQYLWMYHPRKFHVDVNVLPEHRHQGIGTALYNRILEALAQYDPIELMTGTREDYEDGMRFIQNRGFKEVMREWESRLDPTNFDPTPYAGLEQKMKDLGIEIKTVRELESDPERDRKLYELDKVLTKDVPSPNPPTAPDFEQYQKVWKNPNLLPDAWFVAVHNGEYVGSSNLWKSHAGPQLYTGLTGVRREYRKKGIATALKLKAIAYAQAHGNPIIYTWNEANNVGMLGINIRLGFVRQPASVEFSKKLKDE